MIPLLLTINISRPPVISMSMSMSMSMYHVLSDERLRCSMPFVLAVLPAAYLVDHGQPHCSGNLLIIAREPAKQRRAAGDAVIGQESAY